MCKLHEEDLPGVTEPLNTFYRPTSPAHYIRQQQLENLMRLKQHQFNGNIDAKINQIAEKLVDKWLKELENE